MIIQYSQGRVNADYYPRSGCPLPCPERAATLKGRIERLRAYQRRIIEEYLRSLEGMNDSI